MASEHSFFQRSAPAQPAFVPGRWEIMAYWNPIPLLVVTCSCSSRKEHWTWMSRGFRFCSAFTSSSLEKNVPPVLITLQCLDHVSGLCKQGWHLAGFSWHKVLYIWVWSIRAVSLNMLPLQFRPSENLFTYFKATLRLLKQAFLYQLCCIHIHSWSQFLLHRSTGLILLWG